MLKALIAGMCILASGCARKDDLVVWKEALPSPDGAWTASVDTVQNGGFGSGGISTSVYLSKAGDTKAPTEVLEFSSTGPIPRPYVLDNAANKGGSINLTMKWISPAHLDVTFTGHPDMNLQVVKFAGIEISAHELPRIGHGS